MSQPRHLSPDVVRRLVAGDLPPEEARAWAAHLDTDCAECEAVLAADGAPGALDGAADAALADFAERSRSARLSADGRGNDLEFARIQRSVRQRSGGLGRRLAPLAAAAAVALIGGGVALKLSRAPRHDDVGVKGTAAAKVVPARLRFLVERGAEVERGASGQVLPQDARLLFRIEVGAPAYATLVRVGRDRQELFSGRIERAGAVDVGGAAGPAAYTLDGLEGPQRFVLVASPEPIEPADLAAATGAGRASARGDSTRAGLTVDVVEVTVR